MSKPKYEVFDASANELEAFLIVKSEKEWIESGNGYFAETDNKANATLICDALNQHDTLVEALRGLVEDAIAHTADGDYYCTRCDSVNNLTIERVRKDAIEHDTKCPVRLAQEALGKAEATNE